MKDIVFPNKNEKEFISIAEKLGTSKLIFIYPFQKDVVKYKEEINSLQSLTKVKLEFGLSASPKDIPKAKNISKFVITSSSEKDQYVMEKLKPNLIYGLELDLKKDKFNYRISGLNQVLCNFCFKNKIIIGVSSSSILNSNKRTQLLGRIAQNLKFSNKYKLETLFASFTSKPSEMRNLKDLLAFKVILRKN